VSFTPPAGKAGVYAIAKRAAPLPVTLDTLPFGTVQSRYYLYGALPPGEHVVGVLSGEGSKVGKFTAEAGRNYFFLVGMGWVGGKVTKELDEEEGKKLVRKYRLSGDNHFEFDEDLKR
jgi:hypothetical protein